MRIKDYGDNYRVFKIDDGETHYAVEMTEEEAIKSHGVENLFYATVEEYLNEVGPIKCEVVPAMQHISVRNEEGEIEIKPAKDWAVKHRGVFCSSCW